MSENELTDTQLTDALNKMIRLDPNVDKLSRAQVVVSHIGLVEERDDYRAVLTNIASYEEGEEVTGGFDNPADARSAREVLEKYR